MATQADDLLDRHETLLIIRERRGLPVTMNELKRLERIGRIDGEKHTVTIEKRGRGGKFHKRTLEKVFYKRIDVEQLAADLELKSGDKVSAARAAYLLATNRCALDYEGKAVLSAVYVNDEPPYYVFALEDGTRVTPPTPRHCVFVIR